MLTGKFFMIDSQKTISKLWIDQKALAIIHLESILEIIGLCHFKFKINFGFDSEFCQIQSLVNSNVDFPYFYVPYELYDVIESMLVARDDGRLLWVLCDSIGHLPNLELRNF